MDTRADRKTSTFGNVAFLSGSHVLVFVRRDFGEANP
jgi:hypothetical protein